MIFALMKNLPFFSSSDDQKGENRNKMDTIFFPSLVQQRVTLQYIYIFFENFFVDFKNINK